MKKRMCSGHGDPPVEFSENGLLHIKYLLAGVGPVGDVYTVAYFRRVNLLVLAGHKKGSHSNKLELATLYWYFTAITVNNVDAEVKCVGIEAEFHVDFDQPVNKDGTHFGINILLAVHVWMWLCSCLTEETEVVEQNEKHV